MVMDYLKLILSVSTDANDKIISISTLFALCKYYQIMKLKVEEHLH